VRKIVQFPVQVKESVVARAPDCGPMCNKQLPLCWGAVGGAMCVGGGGVDSALTPGFNLLAPRQKGRSACSGYAGLQQLRVDTYQPRFTPPK
jgi:hypothetical protein